MMDEPNMSLLNKLKKSFGRCFMLRVLMLTTKVQAESHPHSCLGSWLHTGLDPGKAGDREDAVLLHFCCGKGCQALEGDPSTPSSSAHAARQVSSQEHL